MASTKNILQEYFQRNKLSMPYYSTDKTDKGEWISTVKFSVNCQNYNFEGSPSAKKRQAECNAANKALEEMSTEFKKIQKTKISHLRTVDVGEIFVPTRDQDKYTYVLVDFENISKIARLNLLDHQTSTLTVLRFVSHLHVKAVTDEVNCVIDSSIKDAVDHYISFYVGGLCNKIPTTVPLYIFILTRDHFASSIPTFVQGYSNVTVKHCGTEEKCIDELRKLGIN